MYYWYTTCTWYIGRGLPDRRNKEYVHVVIFRSCYVRFGNLLLNNTDDRCLKHKLDLLELEVGVVISSSH